MSNLSVTSRSQFEKRRRQLRWQKRWRVLKLLWQTTIAGSMAGGLVWLIAQPNWIIREPDQIDVEGMEFLSEETVRSLIPIAYPASIFDVNPEAIAQILQERGPIDTVAVQRQLFPPSLSVHITERHPVALLLGNSYTDPFATAEENEASPQLRAALRTSPTGLMDENGSWLPLESYTNVRQDVDLPELRVIGMKASYRQAWATLYETLQHSPIEVYEIDWQNPTNLIINTELGFVHLGPYREDHFKKQLLLLDRMRNLSKTVELSHIDYIDIRALDNPMLQFHPTAPQYSQTILEIPEIEAPNERGDRPPSQPESSNVEP